MMIMLKLTTVFFFICLSVLAGLHILSLKLYLYWTFPWLDMPVHFFGGAVVALGIFTISDFIREFPSRFLYVVPVMSGVVVVALSWELFELFAGVAVPADGFIFDVITDLIFGIAGGFVGFLVGHSIRKL